MTEETTAEPELKTVVGDYQRRRPFLIVTSVQRPVKGARTEKAKPPLQRSERASVVDSLSDVHLREADAIIDIMNRTAVKSRFGAFMDRQTVVDTYLSKFAETVSEGVAVWARKRGMAQGL